MELVLGLAALATAVSGMAGAGHYSTIPEKSEVEPTTVEATETIHQQEIQGINDGLMPRPNIGDLIGFQPKDPDFIPNDPYHDETNQPNDTIRQAQYIGEYLNDDWWSFTKYGSTRSPHSVSTQMRGRIDAASDVDWYSFALYGNATVTLDLSRIALDCNYNLELFKKENTPNVSADQVQQIGYSGWAGNHDEHISQKLSAGVYYVKVYPYGDCYAYTKYYLDFDITYENKQPLSISDMTSKGAKGAIWYADYDPFGIKPTSQLLSSSTVGTSYYHKSWSRNAVGEETSTNSYNPEFPFTSEKAYKQAEIFVWDDDLKVALAGFFQVLYTEALAKQKEENQLRIQAQINEDAGMAVFNVVKDTAVSVVSIEVPIVGWIALGIDFLVEFISAFFPSNMTYNRYDSIVNYIENIWIALRCSQGNGKPIRIPACYSVTSSNTTIYGQWEMSSTTTYTFSYVTPRTEEGEIFDFVYEGSDIRPIDWEGQSPFTGTVYPICFANDINRAFNNREVRKLFDHALVLDEGKTISKINQGEYEWLSFTAPHSGHFRIRSTGAWNAAVHVCNFMTEDLYPYASEIIAREYRTPGYDEGFSYDFNLSAGETLYFRVCGSIDGYNATSSMTVTVTEIPLESIVNIYPDDFSFGTTWNNTWQYQNLSIPCNIYVGSKGVFYNTERNTIEMRCDRDGICPAAFFNLYFDRPIKSFSFGTCIGNSYSYAALGLYVYALDEEGDTAVIDIANSYCNDTLIPNCFNYKNEQRDVGHDIYAICFQLDPDTDLSPYHVSYQEQLLGDFVVEFAD